MSILQYIIIMSALQGILFLGLAIVLKTRIKELPLVFSIGVALTVPFVFIFSIFFSRFETNLCYSGALSYLSDSAEIAVSSNSVETKELFTNRLKKIPNHGYESSCDEIEAYVKRLYEDIKSQKP